MASPSSRRIVSGRDRPTLSPCAEIVRDHARDRWLATLFAPPEAREALLALYAFDHEIARVADAVSQPMPGLIRLQWWRDALDGIDAGRPLAHPVVLALHREWPRLAPARESLHAAIDARERDLEDEAFADAAALEPYLEAASTGITLAALEVLGVRQQAARAAGSEIGLARGLVGLLRSAAAGGAGGRLLPATSGVGLAAQGRSLGERARAHLRAARRLRPQVPRAALPALLPAALLADDLARLERAGHDPGSGALMRRPALAPLKLLWLNARGVF
jgi:NADH dehydrogenase [ubiquinone] 1 alpha subcomplex assembly factor 6